MKPKRAKTMQLPELPLLLCVHCQQMTTTPCPKRAWKVAETCPEMKKAEDDFYRRNAGGPVAMTSMTRGRGFSGILHDNDRHVASYHTALDRVRLYGDWRGPPWQQAEWWATFGAEAAYAAMAADDSG